MMIRTRRPFLLVLYRPSPCQAGQVRREAHCSFLMFLISGTGACPFGIARYDQNLIRTFRPSCHHRHLLHHPISLVWSPSYPLAPLPPCKHHQAEGAAGAGAADQRAGGRVGRGPAPLLAVRAPAISGVGERPPRPRSGVRRRDPRPAHRQSQVGLGIRGTIV
jgi:hypothetical protein